MMMVKWKSLSVGRNYEGSMDQPKRIEPFFEPLESLQRLLSRFGERGVIIGGTAVSILGKARYTEDIDAMFFLSTKDIPHFLDEARKEGIEARIENAAEFAKKTRVLLLKHVITNTKIDISLGILPFEQEMIDRSIVHQVDATLQIRLPTPEDLIILKAVAHRPKDLEDIRILVDKYQNLDISRIERWVKSFAEVLEMPTLWEDIAGLFEID
jgi:predicted nucleotidyltransferase